MVQEKHEKNLKTGAQWFWKIRAGMKEWWRPEGQNDLYISLSDEKVIDFR